MKTSLTNDSKWRFITCLMATAMLMVFSATESEAQCTPDCFDSTSTWGLPDTAHIELDFPCQGCMLDVVYVTRIACGVFQDLQITEIAIVNDSCGCPAETLFEAGFQALLRLEPPIFPNPDTGQCATTWRISAASCFSLWEIYLPGDSTGITLMYPCAVEECCLTQLRVCRDSTGAVDLIQILSGPNGGGNCSTAEPTVGDSTCFTTCEFNNLELSKGSIPSGRVIREETSSTNHALALPNPVTGSIVDFKLKVNAQGIARLNIYDIQGRLVLEQKVQLQDGVTRVTMDVGQLQAGSYVYELSAAGRILVSDKLLINK